MSRRLAQDQAASPLILLAAAELKAAQEIPANYVLRCIADCKKEDDNIVVVTLCRKEIQPVFLFLKGNEKEIK